MAASRSSVSPPSLRDEPLTPVKNHAPYLRERRPPQARPYPTAMLFRVLRLTILAGAICGTSPAGVIYTETINGDVSNSGLNPTVVTVALGSNSLFGTTGNPGTGIDRDYLTLTVPNGLMLSSITVLPGTFSG